MNEDKFRGWNKALIGAYKKGVNACNLLYTEGIQTECPYEDKRNDAGKLTWSRSFIAAWEDGFRDREKEIISINLNGKKSAPPANR